MLKYPPYSQTEFNCLDPGLYVVEFLVNLNQIRDNLRTLNAAREKKMEGYGSKGEPMLAALQNTIAATVRTERDKDVRLNVLKHHVEQFRRTMSDGTLQGVAKQVKRKTITDALQEMYGQFNSEQFLDDFHSLYAEEMKKTEMDRELQSLHGKVGRQQALKKDLMKTLPKCFREERVPRSWRQWMLSEHWTEENMALAIVEAFQRDWRQRCTLFEVPVTIYGTGLHTLPRHLREPWDKAFKALGLDKLKRSSVFMFLTSKTAEVDVIDTKTKPMPGLFGAEGMKEEAQLSE